MVNVVDPPKLKGAHPVMSSDLKQALGAIQKGAEERLEVLKSKARKMGLEKSSGETVPVLVGHIEKVDPGEGKEEEGTLQKEEETRDRQPANTADQDSGKKQTTDKTTLRKRRTTQSVSKIKEQKKRWQEVTKKGLGDVVSAEVDLEEAMMSEESEKQDEKDKDKPKECEGYGKVYTKTNETRSKRSLSRAEKREQEEKRKKVEADRKAAQLEADRYAKEEAKRISEREWLEQEELNMQKKIERKRKIEEDKEKEVAGEPSKVSTTSKQQWKEKLGLKARKRRHEEEEVE